MIGMALVRCEGIVLKVRDFGEADRILTVLSGSEGKFEALARGARRPRSRLVGVTQQFAQVNLLLFRGRNLDTISSAELVSAHSSLWADVARMAYGSYMAELVDKMTGERERNDQLYSLVAAAFDTLDSGALAPRVAALAFEIKFMAAAGFLPELGQCVLCGAPAEQGVGFGPEAGGLVCGRCRPTLSDAVSFGPASRETARLLLALAHDRLGVLKPREDTLDELEKAFRAYVDQRVERKLHSLDFIRDLRRMEQEGGQG
jgi:DNA repair protein RecO (recombination protein O)